jgi:hypothetical protein
VPWGLTLSAVTVLVLLVTAWLGSSSPSPIYPADAPLRRTGVAP